MRFRVLANPTAGRGASRKCLDLIRRRIGEEPLFVAASVGELRQAAREAARAGVERVIVAGGDGTMHQVLQELAGSSTAMAVLPLGSGNDMAGALEMPKEPAAALEKALTAPLRRIDLGRIDGRYFGLYCGFGFDGEVSRTYNEKVRWVRGTPGYVWSVLRAMMRFQPPAMRLEHDDGVIDGRLMLAVAANAPRCGGGMLMAPMASLSDGRLELITLDPVGRGSLLLLLARVFRGRHLDHPKVGHVTVSGLEVRSDRALWAYGDGEPLVELLPDRPVDLEVVPRALRVVSPALSSPRRSAR